jgi:peptidoglycan biosynthesis protein MviN/MurJ (putative lipid II flippase)
MKSLTELRKRPMPVLVAQALLAVAAMALVHGAWLHAADVEWRQRTGEGGTLFLGLLYAAAAVTAVATVVGLGGRTRPCVR